MSDINQIISNMVTAYVKGLITIDELAGFIAKKYMEVAKW